MYKGHRGMLTTKARKISTKFLGRELTVKELRLLPYLDYCMKNDSCMNRSRMNEEEVESINTWIEEGHLFGTIERIWCTRKFYRFMQSILAECYMNFMAGQFLPPKKV
jgi:hypothetical protein